MSRKPPDLHLDTAITKAFASFATIVEYNVSHDTVLAIAELILQLVHEKNKIILGPNPVQKTCLRKWSINDLTPNRR